MIGKTILHYKVLEKLGEGGMGIVYLAEDTKLERKVAIKFLPSHIARNSDEQKRFEIEAKAAAALNHPNIATIHAIEHTDDDVFIVMEYIDGQELREKITADRLLPIAYCTDIATQITSGLQAAHENDIIHRDIKSSNIMLTDQGQAKIMDFGLAKIRGGHQLTKEQSSLGTAAYMSPEQVNGDELDERTDIWSFGIVLYEMISGERPFKGDYDQAVIYSVLNEDVKPILDIRKDMPPALIKIINRCIMKNPEDRYQSSADLLFDLNSLREADKIYSKDTAISRLLRKPVITISFILFVVTLAVILYWIIARNTNIEQVRNEIMPRIEQLTNELKSTDNGQNSWTAFKLGKQAADIIPDDPHLKLLNTKYLRSVSILSQPSDVDVFAKAYGDTSKQWHYFGKTPLASIDFPFSFSQIRLEKDGYKPAYDIVWNAEFLKDTLAFKMMAAERAPEEMVLVHEMANNYDIPAAPAGLHMPGLEQFEFVPVGDFLMDRFEVTNKDFKKFVDASGYKNKTYWKQFFADSDQGLTWEESMASFVDKTGQPGPATWEVGDYPQGQDDFPVSGVSFFEAAAYAEFAGKNLPTIYHWDRVALTWGSSAIVPQSNLMGTGLMVVGSSNSMNRFGTYDLAGNVREWCMNKSSRGGHFILGGGWNDAAYGFNDAYAQSPLDRSETNGFRCIRYLESEANHALLESEIQLPFRDFLNETPVSDEYYQFILSQYAYDKSPLNQEIKSVSEGDDWIRQEISFDAAYGNERMKAYLFLPKKGKPPFQTLIFFPGSGAIHTRSSQSLKPNRRTEFLLKSGRALMYPIYKSTYEREDALKSDYPDETNFWKDHVIMWTKDFSRSIDYLETHEDIDADKLVYYGVSWGGGMGGIVPAVEKRIKGCVLLVAGLLFQKSLPEADPVNFLPRIIVPVLMLNGKYDFFFPYETSQLPFFKLLGTAPEHKKIMVYEGGHSVPKIELAKETLQWLDHYLGPVK